VKVKSFKQDKIFLIQLDNAPVNALSHAIRSGLSQALKAALDDEATEAIVVTGSGGFFSAGADINEFATPLQDPGLPEVLRELEQAGKPVIAAMNGTALGGGLEMALACHYRICIATAKLGLPEVHLGLLPGAGGTQRLPRLCGVETALNMIVTGTPVTAKQALEAGFVDRLAEPDKDFIVQATAYAKELLAAGAVPRRTCDLTIDEDALAENFFNDYRQKIARKTRGFFAPERCIQAVEATRTLTFEEGLQKETELFHACLNSPESAAQRHLFFAERTVSAIPDVPRDTPVRPIKQVAIIGAGTMGGGIAMNFANAGIPVKLLELKPEMLDRGLGIIYKNYVNTAKKGRLTQAQVKERFALISGTLDYGDLNDADLVIEAVFENMEVKKAVFTELDKVCKPGAILATNTSTLDVDVIADFTSRPADVIGLHFFSPANVMRLLEIVRGKKTAKDVIATAMQMAKTIKKVGVLVGVCYGFVGNRMLEPYSREAHRLLLEGATPAQIDKVLYDLGMAMGPFTMYDMAGIDVGYLVRESRREALAHDPSYCIVGDKLAQMGRHGQKTGRGYYIYDPQTRARREDPEVVDLCIAEAERLGITRRDISDDEIRERCLYTLINEGALILEEGIALRSGDIDVIWCNGYGFPACLGGPMQYADQIGPDKVYQALCRYRDELGEHGRTWFSPAKLLEKLAKEKQKFSTN